MTVARLYFFQRIHKWRTRGKKLVPSHESEALENKQISGTQRQFSENICSEDDLRSRIFGKFVVKFLACLPLLGFSSI